MTLQLHHSWIIHFLRVLGTLSSLQLWVMKCAPYDKSTQKSQFETSVIVALYGCVSPLWPFCLATSWEDKQWECVGLEVTAAVCYVPLIQAAIDFLRFELITCFTRETGLQWNPLRSPLILQKLPHGLADGFTEMCFPIENNYTGDCGAGINLEHTVSILNISKQP